MVPTFQLFGHKKKNFIFYFFSNNFNLINSENRKDKKLKQRGIITVVKRRITEKLHTKVKAKRVNIETKCESGKKLFLNLLCE